MFNIIPVLETIAPIVGGIAGIINSVNSSPSTTTTPVVVEQPKCEVFEKAKEQPQVQMPNIVFNLNIYLNGKKVDPTSNDHSNGIYIETK